MKTVSWLNHQFTVYTKSATWNDVAGIYIFARINGRGQWEALYVGQADSLRTRIPGHERREEAERLGATHVHAKVVPLAATRDSLEAELIQAFQPPLNSQLR